MRTKNKRITSNDIKNIRSFILTRSYYYCLKQILYFHTQYKFIKNNFKQYYNRDTDNNLITIITIVIITTAIIHHRDHHDIITIIVNHCQSLSRKYYLHDSKKNSKLFYNTKQRK